jgi:hypothetical protein
MTMRRCSPLLSVAAVAVLVGLFATACAVETQDFNASALVNTFTLTGSLPVPAGTVAPGSNAAPKACPQSIQHVEYTKLAQQDTVFSIDFDKIVSDGAKCSDRDAVKDRYVRGHADSGLGDHFRPIRPRPDLT